MKLKDLTGLLQRRRREKRSGAAVISGGNSLTGHVLRSTYTPVRTVNAAGPLRWRLEKPVRRGQLLHRFDVNAARDRLRACVLVLAEGVPVIDIARHPTSRPES